MSDMHHPLRDDAVMPPFDNQMALHAEMTALRQQLATMRAERDAARRAMEASQARLQRAIYVVSHELRTPMTSIKAGTQMIARRLRRVPNDNADILRQSTVTLLDLLNIVQRQVDQQDRLIRDLVMVSRIDANRLAIQVQSQDFSVIIDKAVAQLHAQYPDRSVRFTRPSQPALVAVDADQLHIVLQHLLLNAVGYSPPESQVEVTLIGQPEHWCVAINDQGPGIPTDALTKIWDPFYSIPNSVSTIGLSAALGLGLYLSRGIITLHDGQIGVESTPGRGSTFWFTLPRASND